MMMRRAKSKPTTKRAQRQLHNRLARPETLPFIAHIYELRRRLFYVAVSVGIFSAFGYAVQKQLTALLLKPAGNQQFIYTSPGGGFDFQFRICLYTGIAISIPVIVYHILRYINPLLNHETKRFLALATLWSSVMAASGIIFGYILGLPAAMHFLLQGFSTTKQIEALISIQSYMSFVMTYLLGTALLFQIPLILILINRIKPLPPKKLLKQQRWLIVLSLIVGAIISPTPDVRNQLVFSLPIIVMYDVTVGIIWLSNRSRRQSPKIAELIKKDQEKQATRLARFQKAQQEWGDAVDTSATTSILSQPKKPATMPVLQTLQATQLQPLQPVQTSLRPQRPNRYMNDFGRRSFVS